MSKAMAAIVALVVILAASARAYNLPLVYQLFGPAQGAGVYTAAHGPDWQHPTGVTSTSKTFLFGYAGGTQKYLWVRALAVWTPVSPNNCFRIVYWYADYADGAARHELGRFCGSESPWGLGLIPQGIDLTTQINALVDQKRDVYIAYQLSGDSTPLSIWEVRLEMFQDVEPLTNKVDQLLDALRKLKEALP